MFFSDKVLVYAAQTFKGRKPPVAFYVRAWGTTLQRWSDAVRTESATLKDLVRAVSQYKHYWTKWVGTGAAEQSSHLPDADQRLQKDLVRSKRS